METILQSNFGGGEIAPKFWNDKSLKQYPVSMRAIRNFKVDRAGKLKRCPGTVYVPGSGPSVGSTRMIPFLTGPQSGYALQFYYQSIAVIQNGKMVLANTTAWSSTTAYVAGQTVASGSNVYVALNNQVLNVNQIPASSPTFWQNLGANTGLVQYSIPSPYSATDAQFIKYRQVNGVLYLVHPNYPPQQIILSVINGLPCFSCSVVPFSPSQQSLVYNEASSPTGQTTYPYKYLITTENLATGEESFPGYVGQLGSPVNIRTVATNVVLTGTFNQQQFNGSQFVVVSTTYQYLNYVTVTTFLPHGFSVGESISFSGIADTGPHTINGTTVTITSVTPTTFTFSPYYTFHTGSPSFVDPSPGNPTTGTGGTAKPSTAISISAISKNNPCKITATGHGFISGDIVTLVGTGISQIDQKPFYVGVIDVNNFVLAGIDSSNFVIPTIITGQAFPNILKTALNAVISPTNPNTLSWTATIQQNGNNNVAYNIYRNDGSGFGFVATAYGLSYVDTGTPADLNQDPPGYNALFLTPGNYPSVIEVFQQRLMFFNTRNNPLEYDASRSGSPSNFTDHQSGIQANDAIVQQTLQTEAASSVSDAIDLGFLVVFTDQHEIVFRGDQTGTVTPEAVNATRQMFNGASPLRPLKANKSVIFLQANTSMIRDLQVELTPYGMTYLAKSTELTFYSSHLVEGFSINDWDYQKIYDSMIYAVRNDGIIISTPYNVEQGIDAAWARRDTQGTFGNICCVPEGLEIAVYVTCLRKQANTSMKWGVERFSSDQWTNLLDANYLDAATIVDGRSSTIAPATSMTLSLTAGSTLWDGTQNLTLTASAAFFTAGMVGDWVFLTGSDGKTSVKFQIGAFVNSTTVTGVVQGTVPDGINAYGTDGAVYVNMRNVAMLTWGHAVQTVNGIPIGGPVAVVGDGMVQSNPYNLQRGQTVISVPSSGTITIPQPAVVIIVGLPYFSDLELLNLDQDPKDSLINKKTVIKQAACMVTSTQGYWVGSENPDTNKQAPQNIPGPVQTPNYVYGLTEANIREQADYNSSVDMITGLVLTDHSGKIGYGSRLFIRCVDPIPCNFSGIGFAVDIPSMGK